MKLNLERDDYVRDRPVKTLPDALAKARGMVDSVSGAKPSVGKG